MKSCAGVIISNSAGEKIWSFDKREYTAEEHANKVRMTRPARPQRLDKKQMTSSGKPNLRLVLAAKAGYAGFLSGLPCFVQHCAHSQSGVHSRLTGRYTSSGNTGICTSSGIPGFSMACLGGELLFGAACSFLLENLSIPSGALQWCIHLHRQLSGMAVPLTACRYHTCLSHCLQPLADEWHVRCSPRTCHRCPHLSLAGNSKTASQSPGSCTVSWTTRLRS